jgi:uncharacterized protein (DUF2062 family)
MTKGRVSDRAPYRLPLRRLLALGWKRLRGGELSPERAAAAAAIGLFIGAQPLYGLHLALCLAICLPLRLDVLIAYAAANVSNPLVAPALLALEVEVGSLVLYGEHLPMTLEEVRSKGVLELGYALLVGAVLTGVLLAALGGSAVLLVAGWFRWRQKRAPLRGAMRRTRARYREAPIGDRVYVTLKLWTDPVLQNVAALPFDFGKVLDAGCGRGQLGLWLLELGKARSLQGFDSDERKVEVARHAAQGKAEFERGDLRAVTVSDADTLLLVDVLHYLPREDQRSLLRRVALELPVASRILIRDIDADAGLRSWFTELCEGIGKFLGMNRAGALSYRSSAEVAAELEALGLVVSVRSASQGTPFANVLIVAERPALPEAARGQGSDATSSIASSEASTRSEDAAPSVSARIW